MTLTGICYIKVIPCYSLILLHKIFSESGPKPSKDVETLKLQASHCNVKKDKAKKADDLSRQLYFAVYVKVLSY